jgi:HAD superfamily hydrolase (TIGR01458 family)
MSRPLAGVRAVLADLEGTVYEAGRPIPGAASALAALTSNGIALVFITNTTSRPRSQLVAELKAMGIPAEPGLILTAPRAARDYLLGHGWQRCHLMVRPAVMEDFEGVAQTDDAPDAVVVGDLGEDFSYARLNRAFRLLIAGAGFVTLARNRFYRAADGLVLDQGPFVAASSLELAAGRPATLVGKPSKEFFRAAMRLAGGEAPQIAVVGDDLDVDVGGGQALGMRGVLVRTGKFREEDVARSPFRADAILDSIADLPGLL